MKLSRGFTLLELLISVAILGAVTMGCVEVMSVAIGFNEHLRAGRSKEQSRRTFEDRMTDLLKRVYVDPVNNANPSTFFVGQAGNSAPPGQSVQPGETVSASGVGQAGSGATGQTSAGVPIGANSSGGDSDTLMLTVIGRKPAAAALASTDDFETNNQNFGPQGGIAEYQVSTTPVGDSQGKQGLVLRQQVPADQDATQGGTESILEPDITRIRFQFFDGTTWQTSWNTFAQTTRQLPNAVRVSYQIAEEQNERVFIVRLPLSNVTPLSPATQTGGSQ